MGVAMALSTPSSLRRWLLLGLLVVALFVSGGDLVDGQLSLRRVIQVADGAPLQAPQQAGQLRYYGELLNDMNKPS
ncbi:hypothetical protein ACP70R_047823 [Stipagrostis hirtigluma subsp. patula]